MAAGRIVTPTAFSLFEMMIALVLMAVLLLVLPLTSNWTRTRQLTVAAEQLRSELQFARHTAIDTQSLVTVCGSQDGKHCTQDWQHGLLVRAATQQHYFPPLVHAVQVSWQSNFGRNQQLQFEPTGFTHGQQGHFQLQLGAAYVWVAINFNGELHLKAFNKDSV